MVWAAVVALVLSLGLPWYLHLSESPQRDSLLVLLWFLGAVTANSCVFGLGVSCVLLRCSAQTCCVGLLAPLIVCAASYGLFQWVGSERRERAVAAARQALSRVAPDPGKLRLVGLWFDFGGCAAEFDDAEGRAYVVFMKEEGRAFTSPSVSVKDEPRKRPAARAAPPGGKGEPRKTKWEPGR